MQRVRSVRSGRKVVQQTVAHLAELDAHGRARAKAGTRAITSDREQSDLFVLLNLEKCRILDKAERGILNARTAVGQEPVHAARVPKEVVGARSGVLDRGLGSSARAAPASPAAPRQANRRPCLRRKSDSRVFRSPSTFVEDHGDEVIPVRLKRIRLERGPRFGDVWLGWTLWRALRLDEALTRLLPEGREAVPWATMAAVLVLARLCEPSSELHIAETWYRGTALEDLLALPAPLVNDDRLYRALDRLVAHKPALEQHLVARLGELFALDYDLLLYDVTSVYFEGAAEANPLARRGHSRDHRPDCKQVCLALVVTRDGMPLGYEVFAGNRTDVTTVEEIVEAMETRYGMAQRIWVMDRGMTSEDNLEWLRQTGWRYLVGTPKSELKKWAGAIAEARDWQAVREGIEAKQWVGPDGLETFVLIRSVERREKERAMHERFARRTEEGLERLGRRIRQARRALDVRRLERQLGRLLERNQRAAVFRIQKSELGIRPVWHQRTDPLRARRRPNLPLHPSTLQEPALLAQAAPQPGQALLNAPAEAVVHNPLLLAPLDRVHQHEGRGPVRTDTGFCLDDALTHSLPVLGVRDLPGSDTPAYSPADDPDCAHAGREDCAPPGPRSTCW